MCLKAKLCSLVSVIGEIKDAEQHVRKLCLFSQAIQLIFITLTSIFGMLEDKKAGKKRGRGASGHCWHNSRKGPGSKEVKGQDRLTLSSIFPQVHQQKFDDGLILWHSKQR